MRVLFTGGGSGGHIYPGLSLWRYIEQNDPDASLLYVGAKQGLEHTIVPHEGLSFETIQAAPLRRQLSPAVLRTVWKTYSGYRQAKRIIRQFRPDVVVGTGGYVTLPVIYAASAMKVPSVIWEGNAVPGLTNRLCAKKATTVAVCFEGSERTFPEARHVVVTGNPRASEVHEPDAEARIRTRQKYGLKPGNKLILCYAGSRGSESINEALARLYPRFAERSDWQLIHVVGPNLYESLTDVQKQSLPENVQLQPFIHDMPQLLPQADCVITRAGSSTLAEVCAFGIPAILIPSPYVPANHQEENAKRLSENGAAVLLRERELSEQTLWQELERLLDTDFGHTVSQAARRLATTDAVERFYDVVVDAMKTSWRQSHR